MNEPDIRLMKGNEALAEAAILAGCDGYFGYPITPQSEVMEYLMVQKPEERTGMVVLQAESEIASIYMCFGGASCGKKVMTSSSSPGISLMMEGISYMAGAELPCLIANIARGGPGLGTIQPGQSDYFQSVKGGGHGDYRMVVLAPASVQEMADHVFLGYELAFKYRNPVMILSDGALGQMMEKVTFPQQKPRSTEKLPWATTGKTKDREHNIVTSLNLVSEVQEEHVTKLMKKYKMMEENEVRYEAIMCDDAEYLFVAYGTSARICEKAMRMARAKGIKVGLFRPITLFPFPLKEIAAYKSQLKGVLTVEMSAGQMIEDVQMAIGHHVKVEFFGRYGGIIPNPDETLAALEKKFINI